MTKEMVEGSEKGKDSLQTDHLVPNAKDVSTYPGNEEGSVQPTTATLPATSSAKTPSESARVWKRSENITSRNQLYK